MDGGDNMMDDTTSTLIINGIASFTGNTANNSSGGELQYLRLRDMRAIRVDLRRTPLLVQERKLQSWDLLTLRYLVPGRLVHAVGLDGSGNLCQPRSCR